jgi:hypothetical protein
MDAFWQAFRRHAGLDHDNYVVDRLAEEQSGSTAPPAPSNPPQKGDP